MSLHITLAFVFLFFLIIILSVIKYKISPYDSDGFFTIIFISILITIFGFVNGTPLTDNETTEKTTLNVFSTSPPSIENKGFSVGIFYHKNDSTVAYLVRTKVENGYKDIILNNIILNENNKLKDHAEYIENYSCYEKTIVLRYAFFFKSNGDTTKICTLKSKVLYLPVGAIRKVMSI